MNPGLFKERIQFGRPISKNQAIQWMLADMETDINAGRFLYYYAAYLKDQGQPFSKAASMARIILLGDVLQTCG